MEEAKGPSDPPTAGLDLKEVEKYKKKLRRKKRLETGVVSPRKDPATASIKSPRPKKTKRTRNSNPSLSTSEEEKSPTTSRKKSKKLKKSKEKRSDSNTTSKENKPRRKRSKEDAPLTKRKKKEKSSSKSTSTTPRDKSDISSEQSGEQQLEIDNAPPFLRKTSMGLIDFDFIPAHTKNYGKLVPDNRSRAQTITSNTPPPSVHLENFSPRTKDDSMDSNTTSDDFNLLRPSRNPKTGKHMSMRSSFHKMARKSLSHNSSTNKKLLKTMSPPVSPSTTPKQSSTRKRFINRSTTPGESKTQRKREKRTIAIVPNEEMTLATPCAKIQRKHIEKLLSLKYPIYLDFSAPTYRLQTTKFLRDVSDIIKEIDFSDNSLKEFKYARHMSNMKRLNLNNNELFYFDVCGLSSLRFLSLENNKLTSFFVFTTLTGLVHLNLSGNPLENDFTGLKEMQNLKYLDLSRCSLVMKEGEFEASLLSSLVQLPHLTHLCLYDNPFLTEFPELNSLILTRLTQLLYYNNKETDLQRKLDTASRAVSQPKINREGKRLEVESKNSIIVTKNTNRGFADLGDILKEMFFPDDVLQKIFKYLTVGEQLQVSLVCKQWHRISVDILTSQRKYVLDSLNVLVGTPDTTTNELVCKIQSQFPDTPVQVHSIIHFDEELLIRDKALIILFNRIDDELSDMWEDIYNQLSFIYSKRLVSTAKPSPLFPFVDFGIYVMDDYNPIVYGIDTLMESIGCPKAIATKNDGFDSWVSELGSLLSVKYPNAPGITIG